MSWAKEGTGQQWDRRVLSSPSVGSTWWETAADSAPVITGFTCSREGRPEPERQCSPYRYLHKGVAFKISFSISMRLQKTWEDSKHREWSPSSPFCFLKWGTSFHATVVEPLSQELGNGPGSLHAHWFASCTVDVTQVHGLAECLLSPKFQIF